MTLFIDRTDYAGTSSGTTINVNLFNPITSKYGGTALLAASSNTVAWAAPQVYDSREQMGWVFAFSPTSSSNSATSAGYAAVIVTWGDTGLVTVDNIFTGTGLITLTASGANVNVNNTSTTNGRPVYWSYLGLI